MELVEPTEPPVATIGLSRDPVGAALSAITLTRQRQANPPGRV
ncbi:MAG: hypothetical protein OXG37_09945 [Actinomycetia bacterium]|nr:hypothetical protein [Actinomycetes bacterium]